MKSIPSRPLAIIVLTIFAVIGLAACAPITIQIGVPSPTSTPLATLTATSTLTATPTVPLPTDTPSPTSPSAPTSAPPVITIIVPPPQIQPPPLQQPTVPSAPSKPGNFSANGTGTTIAFTWNDSSTNELGFRIYQVGEVAPVITLPEHTSTGGMSYNWAGRPCNLSASYYIRAYNDAGESASSNSDGAVTIPCQPTSFLGTGSGTTISFNWNDLATNEAGFRIYQQGANAPVGTRGPNQGGAGTNFALTGLACNLVAKYTVRAFNSAGETADSNLIQAETIPCGPNSLHITSTTKTTVNYVWTDNATNETGYHVYRDDALYVTLPAHNGTGSMNSDAFQNCGQSHVYSVRAFNYAGESNTSEHVGASTLPCFP